MPALCRISVAFLLGTLIAQTAQSQGTGNKLFGLSGLAKQKGVADELKMTKKQSDAVLKIIQDVNAKHKDDIAKLDDFKGAERYKKESELYKLCADETNKALADTLGADQMKRLRQIHIQQRGPYAFAETEVVDVLKLSKEQQKKIRAVDLEYQKALAEIAKLTDPNEKTKKVTAAIQDAMTKDLAVLTDDQKKAWSDFIGPPYKGK
jgi:hypothetical protein